MRRVISASVALCLITLSPATSLHAQTSVDVAQEPTQGQTKQSATDKTKKPNQTKKKADQERPRKPNRRSTSWSFPLGQGPLPSKHHPQSQGRLRLRRR